MTSKTSTAKKMRLALFDKIAAMIDTEYDVTPLKVPSSITGDSYDLAIPTVDDEGEDICLLVKVSVPRGTRDGNGGYIPYDCYSENEEYNLRVQEKEEKAKAKAKKQKKAEEEEEE